MMMISQLSGISPSLFLIKTNEPRPATQLVSLYASAPIMAAFSDLWRMDLKADR